MDSPDDRHRRRGPQHACRPLSAGSQVGEIEKDELTTLVSSVNLDKARETHYTNIFEMIKGEVPGVIVSGSSIKIRGGSSLTQNTEPLYVVNGVMVSQIGDILPDAVKSIEVLKGTAAAIYGSRAANGVILIKTK